MNEVTLAEAYREACFLLGQRQVLDSIGSRNEQPQPDAEPPEPDAT